MTVDTAAARVKAEHKPLIVNLDDNLVRSDLLVESIFAYLAADPRRIYALACLFFQDKALIKNAIAASTPIDPSILPYNGAVISLMAQARDAGRKVFVTSRSDPRYVAAVASHVGADGWFASDERGDSSNPTKSRQLVEAFGEGGFDYVGGGTGHRSVWKVARLGVGVQPSDARRRPIERGTPDDGGIERPGRSAIAWIKLSRVHQWSKNTLVFVPMLTAHQFDFASLAAAIAAFFAFSLASSAVYIVNDIVDINADRMHPSKKTRPLAAGTISILAAFPVAIFLAALAIGTAWILGPVFAGVLLGYLCLATAYTFSLKRKMLLDVVALAGLYTIRVVGGATAIQVPVSEWLLAFSMFMFTSLALIKRYVELNKRFDDGLPDASRRNYRNADRDIVAGLAAASGFNAVTVFAVYISSDAVRMLYTYPSVLWAICPILMYWLARALMLAHRRLMDDDPIVFALQDKVSLISAAAIVCIIFSAI